MIADCFPLYPWGQTVICPFFSNSPHSLFFPPFFISFF